MFGSKEYKQLEFFRDLTESAAKKSKRFKLPYIGERRIIFKISYEKIVLGAIGFVLTLTLIFSLGVERGKKFGQIDTQQLMGEVEVKGEEAFLSSKSADDVNQDMPGAINADLKEVMPDNLKADFFTIQVIAYKDKLKAGREKDLIEGKGWSSFIIRRENYFLVCAGDFDNLVSAKEKLLDLKKTYRDCFIKKVKKEDLYYE